jgi:hypothetical protein
MGAMTRQDAIDVREHVDQPAGAAGDVVDAQNCLEFTVDGWA